MSFKSQNKNRPRVKGTTPINVTQRSTCNLLIYRWKNDNVLKFSNVNISSRNQLPIDELLKNIDIDELNVGKSAKETSDPIWIRNDVVRCSVAKNKGSSSGTFSITLKRGKVVRNNKVTSIDIDYLKLLSPGDWIMIYMKKGGQIRPFNRRNEPDISSQSGLKMVGIIENVRYIEMDDSVGGKPRLEYIITGKDFGKVFDMNIYFNPILNKAAHSSILGAKFLTDPKKVFGNKALTPDVVMKRLVEFYIGNALNINNQSWFLPPSFSGVFSPISVLKFSEAGIPTGAGKRTKFKGTSIIDIIDFGKIGLQNYSNKNFTGVDPLLGATLITSVPSSGSVWSILQNFSNPLINELYTELEEVQDKLTPSIVFRQFPFSNQAGDEVSPLSNNENPSARCSIEDSHPPTTLYVNLPQLKIHSYDIKQKNVGKSDFERINHMVLVPRILTQSIDPLYVSSINEPSIQRHGLKTLEGQSQYIFNVDKERSNNKYAFKVLKQYLTLLQDWFFFNHNYYNGTLIIDGRNEYVRLGENVYIEDIQQLYHIEGYTHTFNLELNGKIVFDTELRVSRGQTYDKSKAYFIDSGYKDKPSVSIVTSVLEARPERNR